MTKKEKAANKRHELRMCPFCRCKPNFYANGDYWHLHCFGCDMHAPMYDSVEKAAKAWNGVK